MSENNFPKLHNAMWPGLVGKGDEEGQEPPISLEPVSYTHLTLPTSDLV